GLRESSQCIPARRDDGGHAIEIVDRLGEHLGFHERLDDGLMADVLELTLELRALGLWTRHQKQHQPCTPKKPGPARESSSSPASVASCTAAAGEPLRWVAWLC